MEGEKKPKRPRISEARNVNRNDFTESSERNDQTQKVENAAEEQSTYNSRPGYNNDRYRNNDNGYTPRYNNRYNNNGYTPRYNNENNNTEGSTNSTEEGYNNQRSNYNHQRGGYNNYQRGGYNNNNQRGGYNNQRGGYNNQRGGYNNQRGGYNNQRGGYNNQREGHENEGYNNQRGGYNNQRGGYNNQRGGYNNQRGGYNNQRGGYNNNQRGGFNKQRFTPRPQRIEYELPPIDPTQPIRLNKFLANAGICSRREADEFIQAGEVQVNGEVVTELGSKITPADIVTFRGQEVGLENKVYVLLNKPKDCVTTADDPQGRMTVMDIVRNACSERIYPVGRLDRNTTGVLLLTNDGDLASKLTHPKFVKKKIYHVWTDKDVNEEDMQRIADGIELDDGTIHADAVSYATETDRNQIGIEIHSGRNRIVRRIFEALGYHVVKLDRVYFAGLTKKNLPRGRWRYLTQAEVNMLMMGSFE